MESICCHSKNRQTQVPPESDEQMNIYESSSEICYEKQNLSSQIEVKKQLISILFCIQRNSPKGKSFFD